MLMVLPATRNFKMIGRKSFQAKTHTANQRNQFRIFELDIRFQSMESKAAKGEACHGPQPIALLSSTRMERKRSIAKLGAFKKTPDDLADFIEPTISSDVR